ncbi:hypothetical protein LR48_Vigan01g059500 [Vigna angularis]|uniref:Uncharacterized protein n=1 Tax=Phaseolus angularis TaxID=3914 RepID=A0A0L9TKG9_PHAAN|nr:hypothetical protein LR48_Vigan01g059500 [Vigna angularis]
MDVNKEVEEVEYGVHVNDNEHEVLGSKKEFMKGLRPYAIVDRLKIMSNDGIKVSRRISERNVT